MSRRTVPLTVDLVDQVDARCRSCLFWEYDAVSRARLDVPESVADKRAWVSLVLREWGSCGRAAVIDGDVVGHALYAPLAFVPGANGLPTAPPSPDAVLLTTVHVAERHRGGGIGRLLVQGVAHDLARRGHPAIEAFGDTRGRAVGCVMPAEFLGRVGFHTHRPHITSPRMRMDLRTTLSWKDEVEAALERLWGAVRPAVNPAGNSAPQSSRLGRTSD